MKYFPFILSIFLLLNVTYAQDRVTGKTFTTRSEIIAQHGMAATSHPVMSNGGVSNFETGLDYEVIRELVKMGYNIG